MKACFRSAAPALLAVLLLLASCGKTPSAKDCKNLADAWHKANPEKSEALAQRFEPRQFEIADNIMAKLTELGLDADVDRIMDAIGDDLDSLVQLTRELGEELVKEGVFPLACVDIGADSVKDEFRRQFEAGRR